MLEKSVGGDCWRSVVEKSVVEKCCREEVLERSVGEKSCRGMLGRSVGK